MTTWHLARWSENLGFYFWCCRRVVSVVSVHPRCVCVIGAVGGVRAANCGERRGGVTVGDDVGATLVIGVTLGSGAGSKHLGGGIRFF